MRSSEHKIEGLKKICGNLIWRETEKTRKLKTAKWGNKKLKLIERWEKEIKFYIFVLRLIKEKKNTKYVKRNIQKKNTSSLHIFTKDRWVSGICLLTIIFALYCFFGLFLVLLQFLVFQRMTSHCSIQKQKENEHKFIASFISFLYNNKFSF